MKTKKARITYIDDDILWADFPEIVIKVASINEKYGTINKFVSDHDLKGTTNGKLFVMENKEKTDKETQEFIDNLAELYGLEEKKDYFKSQYYNKTLAEKIACKRTIKLHDYDKGWLWSKEYPEGVEMWYMSEDEEYNNITAKPNMHSVKY